MSHHEGVSCDSCLKRNFGGKRYKCLICLDYDLCSACHDAGTLSGRHTSNHPMQCILTRNDLDLFFAGEAVANDQPYSFTCPICGRLGFTDTTLYEHVNVSHSDNSIEVVCPICATLPDGEPNQVTDDFLNHLNMEHRANNNNNQPQIVRVRPRNNRVTNSRRRSQLLNSTSTPTPATAANARDALDPIAHLLSQLSDVRRGNIPSSSNGQNLWQFPFERHVTANRSSLERIFQRQRRQLAPTLAALNSTHADLNSNQLPYIYLDSAPSPSVNNNSANSVPGNQTKINPNYLLNTCALMSSSENELKKTDSLKADRSIFVQELILACLSDSINIGDIINKSSGDEVIVKTQQSTGNELNVTKSLAGNEKGNNNHELTNNNSSANHQMISNETIVETVKAKNQQQSKTPVVEANGVKNLENVNVQTNATTTSANTQTYSTIQQESDHGRQKSMPSLGTSPSFIVTQQTTVSNHSRNNKVSKVRSSPAIGPSANSLALANIRHSSLTASGGPGAAALNVVSPGGRRKTILKQPTEPPPSHYD